MKNNLVTILCLSFLPLLLTAQSDDQTIYRSNALRISPFEFKHAEFQLNYERYFNNRSSSIIIAPSVFLKENNEENIEGVQIIGQYRFYLTHFNKENQPNFLGMYNYGFYTGLYASYLKYTEDFKDGYWNEESQNYIALKFRKEVQAIEGGALVGLEVDVTQRIQIDFYIGGGVRYSDYTNTYEDLAPDEEYPYIGIFDPEYQGVKPKVGFSIGVTF